MKKIKVAVSQRIIPHYRVPVFKELASRKDIDLTVFYGKGYSTGSQVNGKELAGFKSVLLSTIFLSYKGVYGSKQLRVWHPFLFFQLVKGRFDVVIVEPSTNFYNDIFIFIYCKLFRKKFIWHESGSVPKEQRPRFRRLIDPVISQFIKGADAFLTYTSYADESLIRDFNINPAMIFRAQNTVDTSNVGFEIQKYASEVDSTRERLGLTDYKVCLYIGGIEIRKKIINLIKATSKLNADGIPAKTLIVGDGPDIDELVHSMSEEEKSLTVFAGKHVIDATLYVLLSDVVVLPSAGGLSVVQALACGKPFVGSEEIEHGGIKDYVTHGENGFLVKEDDIEDLHSALHNLFIDKNKYNSFCKNAKEKSNELTVQNMVNGFQNAIQYTLSQKNN